MSNLYTPDEAAREHYKDISIIIATPHSSFQSDNDWNAYTMNMIAYSWMQGLKIYQVGYTERQVVHWARNELARQIKEGKNPYTDKPYTHILWLDDDHCFNPDMACFLAQHHEKDMVSALYYARAGRILPIVYTRTGAKPEDDEYKHFPIVQPPNEFFECDAVGFGALLMRVDVLSKFEYPWFRMQEGSLSFGEDISFCVGAKKGGARIWCDARYKLGHINGDYREVIGETHYRKYLETHKEEMGDNLLVRLNTQ